MGKKYKWGLVIAKGVIDDLFEIISEELCNGSGEASVSGFGTFKTVSKSATTTHLPNGSTIEVPERKGIKFIPSNKFKEKLN